MEIPSSVGAVGHSDADVVLHALSDALLGASGDSDIGTLFPDTDPAIAGLDSREIVKSVLGRVTSAGLRVSNVDVVVELERPKLAPHRGAIRESLADLLGIPEDRIGFKAKTGEGIGPVGEGLVIEARAVALLVEREGTA